MCEWWIRAPVGKRIEMTVTDFNSGNYDCNQAYALFNYAGNNFHNSATYRLCGTSRVLVRTAAEQLNVIFNGRVATGPRFTATYRVI
ncbi:uncharacterized protein LOC108680198 [Hyalella azteca]|uniref:Uncharacterized protein LOC108680198 n=1 Tax=Hyalella azteca TaxID=294128 RepID=A0A979FS42_HYAAZ|nr:uncharacterized protein LOC108680198 [Hyalella azteca]